jgi:hypothetical protein
MPRHSKGSKGSSADSSNQPTAKKPKTQRKSEYRPDQDDVIDEAKDGKTRCWGTKSSVALVYHDTFWGRPCYDPTELYGSLCLQVSRLSLSSHFGLLTDLLVVVPVRSWLDDSLTESGDNQGSVCRLELCQGSAIID